MLHSLPASSWHFAFQKQGVFLRRLDRMQFASLNELIDILPGAVQGFRGVCRVNEPFGGKGSEIICRQEYAPRMLS